MASVRIATDPVIEPATTLSTISPEFEAIETSAARERGDSAADVRVSAESAMPSAPAPPAHGG
jgi:hypothetical protein